MCSSECGVRKEARAVDGEFKQYSWIGRRTFSIWNQPNSHPLFAESDARYHAISLKKSRNVLMLVMVCSLGSCVAWTILTFFGESVTAKFDKSTNETYFVDIPRLPIKSWYPWNAMGGMMYIISFVYQVLHSLFGFCCHTIDMLSNRRVVPYSSTIWCSRCARAT